MGEYWDKLRGAPEEALPQGLNRKEALYWVISQLRQTAGIWYAYDTQENLSLTVSPFINAPEIEEELAARVWKNPALCAAVTPVKDRSIADIFAAIYRAEYPQITEDDAADSYGRKGAAAASWWAAQVTLEGRLQIRPWQETQEAGTWPEALTDRARLKQEENELVLLAQDLHEIAIAKLATTPPALKNTLWKGVLALYELQQHGCRDLPERLQGASDADIDTLWESDRFNLPSICKELGVSQKLPPKEQLHQLATVIEQQEAMLRQEVAAFSQLRIGPAPYPMESYAAPAPFPPKTLVGVEEFPFDRIPPLTSVQAQPCADGGSISPGPIPTTGNFKKSVEATVKRGFRKGK